MNRLEKGVNADLKIWNATNSRWKSWRKYMPFQKTCLPLNGFMAYVRRQQAGAREYGDKGIREDQVDYDILLDEEIEQD